MPRTPTVGGTTMKDTEPQDGIAATRIHTRYPWMVITEAPTIGGYTMHGSDQGWAVVRKLQKFSASFPDSPAIHPSIHPFLA